MVLPWQDPAQRPSGPGWGFSGRLGCARSGAEFYQGCLRLGLTRSGAEFGQDGLGLSRVARLGFISCGWVRAGLGLGWLGLTNSGAGIEQSCGWVYQFCDWGCPGLWLGSTMVALRVLGCFWGDPI